MCLGPYGTLLGKKPTSRSGGSVASRTGEQSQVVFGVNDGQSGIAPIPSWSLWTGSWVTPYGTVT
jgi:hypothetical protein